MATRELEQYLLLLLSDSNLPTGTFVASSGLESFVTHGYASTDTTNSQTESVMRFLRHSVHSYAHLNVPFMSDAWQAMIDLRDGISTLEEVYDRITKIDQGYTSMTLNQVASRASTAQGVALLTLYEKALAKPGGEDLFSPIIQRMKVGIRQLTCEGHLSVCFGILTGAVGLGLDAAKHLFLFTHARSLLSSAVRLNLVGPYLSQRLLLHDVRDIVDECLAQVEQYVPQHEEEAHATSRENGTKSTNGNHAQSLKCERAVNTWPLSEILIARHDQLHSRIFNS